VMISANLRRVLATLLSTLAATGGGRAAAQEVAPRAEPGKATQPATGGSRAAAQEVAPRAEPGKATQQIDAEREVLQAQREWGEASLRGYRATIDRILHDEMVGTAATDMGVFWDKRALLARVATGAHPGEHYELSETRVRLYGDAAVLTGIERVRTAEGAPPSSGGSRFTSTYVRSQGRWRCVAYQSLAIASPAFGHAETTPR
jgi:hypothetical protein